MDRENLHTASQYVNNLLLARGLLRDGNAIDFASPSKGGHDATMSDVINLIHDLVLRRDRESDHLSSLSQSIQSIRTNAAQQTQAIARLEKEKSELQNELSTTKSQARTAKLEARSFESKNKAYKEDIQRLRTSVGQIRAQCANDVRKRDTEIARLKKHIDIQRTRDSRSSNSGPGGVTIIDPTTGKAHYPVAALKDEARNSTNSVSLLRDETNEHLTALSAELSESNDALTGLVQSAIAALRTLQGLPVNPDAEQVEANGNHRNSSSATPIHSAHEPMIHIAETPSISSLTAELTGSINGLRSLLTEPSFVPLEEVEIRDAELTRLRAGWETMEAQWREAIGLMNEWQQRMLDDDVTRAAISIDDIQRGMQIAEEGLSVAGSPEQRRQYRGRKRDSSGSEISRASIDTYNDGVTEIGETSTLTQDSIEDDHDEETPKLKKLRFQGIPVQNHGGAAFPPPQVLRPKNTNSKSPTRKSIADVPLMQDGAPVNADSTPLARVEPSVPSRATADLMSPDIWMEPPVTDRDRNDMSQAKGHIPEQRVTQQPAESLQQNSLNKVVGEESKPVKRTALPRKMPSKRRSSLTPAELQGLVGQR